MPNHQDERESINPIQTFDFSQVALEAPDAAKELEQALSETSPVAIHLPLSTPGDQVQVPTWLARALLDPRYIDSKIPKGVQENPDRLHRFKGELVHANELIEEGSTVTAQLFTAPYLPEGAFNTRIEIEAMEAFEVPLIYVIATEAAKEIVITLNSYPTSEERALTLDGLQYIDWTIPQNKELLRSVLLWQYRIACKSIAPEFNTEDMKLNDPILELIFLSLFKCRVNDYKKALDLTEYTGVKTDKRRGENYRGIFIGGKLMKSVSEIVRSFNNSQYLTFIGRKDTPDEQQSMYEEIPPSLTRSRMDLADIIWEKLISYAAGFDLKTQPHILAEVLDRLEGIARDQIELKVLLSRTKINIPLTRAITFSNSLLTVQKQLQRGAYSKLTEFWQDRSDSLDQLFELHSRSFIPQIYRISMRYDHDHAYPEITPEGNYHTYL